MKVTLRMKSLSKKKRSEISFLWNESNSKRIKSYSKRVKLCHSCSRVNSFHSFFKTGSIFTSKDLENIYNLYDFSTYSYTADNIDVSFFIVRQYLHDIPCMFTHV